MITSLTIFRYGNSWVPYCVLTFIIHNLSGVIITVGMLENNRRKKNAAIEEKEFDAKRGESFTSDEFSNQDEHKVSFL